MDMQNIYKMISLYGMKLVVALITLIIGLFVIKVIVKVFSAVLKKRKVDVSVVSFLTSVAGWLLKIALFIAVINQVGIQTTSFVALLGTIGLAIGMALQGSLANFAGGVLILLLKPFKVGDVIKAQGFTGKVEAITTFSTFLKTPDNQVICIPNGGLSNSPIQNINCEEERRVDLTFGIDYADDFGKAKNIIKSLLDKHSKVLKDPAYAVMVGELADSSVNIFVRAWVKTEDYWDVHFDMLEDVKKAFDDQGISFPFPQTDVHVYKK